MRVKFLGCLLLCSFVLAKDFSLEDCIVKARQNYPLYQNTQILNQALELELEKLYLDYMPHLRLNANLSYQNEAIAPPPNYQEFSKNQHKISLELAQPLLDGGKLWANSALKQAQIKVQKANTQNALYQIQQGVINVYFSLLLSQKQLQQNQNHLNTLQISYNNILTRYKNGVALKSDVDKIKIEILNAKKEREALKNQELRFLKHLSLLINEENFKIVNPNFKQNLDFLKHKQTFLQEEKMLFSKRPELEYYTFLQEESIQRQKLETAKSLPYLEAYVQTGYGKPALNMLKDESDNFHIVGLRLNWDFSNLYSTKQQNELVRKQIQLINSQKDEFLLQQKILLNERLKTAKSLQNQLLQNEEMIKLQKQINQNSILQNQNGTLSTNDLLSDLNGLNALILEKNYQEIELLMQIYGIKQLLNAWD